MHQSGTIQTAHCSPMRSKTCSKAAEHVLRAIEYLLWLQTLFYGQFYMKPIAPRPCTMEHKTCSTDRTTCSLDPRTCPTITEHVLCAIKQGPSDLSFKISFLYVFGKTEGGRRGHFYPTSWKNTDSPLLHPWIAKHVVWAQDKFYRPSNILYGYRPWYMANLIWTIGNVLLTLNSVLWAIEHILWSQTPFYGQFQMVYRVCSIAPRAWTVEHKTCSSDRRTCSLEHRTCTISTEHVLRSIQQGPSKFSKKKNMFIWPWNTYHEAQGISYGS